MRKRDRCAAVFARLDAAGPEHIGFLEASEAGAFELLTATILSAQTTDRQVNKVTRELFARYRGPSELAAADPAEVEAIIRSTGYYRAKARNIMAAASMLVHTFESRVPDSMEQLLRLPGVGRKTASVMLGGWFGEPAVIVDTHFSRVVRRLGLTSRREPEKIEEDIRDLLPDEHHYRFSMIINLHGRTVCRARGPECSLCIVCDLCPSCLSEDAAGR